MTMYTTYSTLDTTDEATLVEIPLGYVAKWTMLFLANSTSGSSDAEASVVLYNSRDPLTGDPTDKLINVADNTTVPSGQYLLEDNFTFILQPGQIVTAQCLTAGSVRVAMTFDLTEAPATLLNFTGPPKTTGVTLNV